MMNNNEEEEGIKRRVQQDEAYKYEVESSATTGLPYTEHVSISRFQV